MNSKGNIMIVKKITVGFVVQSFDSETGKCLDQEFVASDDCSFEDEQGEHLDIFHDLYFPLEMKQPE